MSTTAVIDELVEKANTLSADERRTLLKRLNDTSETSISGKRGPSPDIIWIKQNKSKYAGNYVALKNGELIAYGRTIKEADQGAKAKGVTDPLLHYILAEGEEAWGGW